MGACACDSVAARFILGALCLAARIHYRLRVSPGSAVKIEPDDAMPASAVSSAYGDRVRLYLKVTTLINAFLAMLVSAIRISGIAPAEQNSDAVVAVALSVTAINGMAWFAIARSRPSARVALVTEAVATLVLTGGTVVNVLVLNSSPERIDVIVAILLVTIGLVLRSSLVPSPVIATGVLGGLSITAVVVGTQWALPEVGFIHQFWHGAMGAVVVVVTMVTTHTIYGLQQRVHVAKRLGQYQLERRLGGGGMGDVFLASHSLLQRRTAIKLLRDVASERARVRFRKEVQAASGLTHPNTVEIFDYGRTSDGVFYFAMEYVEGASLSDLVKATGALRGAGLAAYRTSRQRARRGSPTRARASRHQAVEPDALRTRRRLRHAEGAGLRPGPGRRGSGR